MLEAWVAGAAIAGAAVIGAGASIYAANKQAGAAENAQNIAQSENQYIQQTEAPYVQSGNNAESQLNYLMGLGFSGNASNPNPGASSAGGVGSLNAPFNVSDWQQLSPMYGFNTQQGKQGVLNTDSTNEGALSGSAQKDLIDFNQANATNSFNTAFGEYQTQNQNVYQRLAGLANLGQAGASQEANSGSALAGTSANAAIAQGQAIGSGITGAASALGTGATNAALYSAYGGGGGGTPGVAGDPNAYTAPSTGSWSADGQTWIPPG
jgi:hypothetical protein